MVFGMWPSGFSKISLDYANFVLMSHLLFLQRCLFLLHNNFSFQGCRSFKEWIVLGESSQDNKPLKIEPLKNNKIVGGNKDSNINGTHQSIIYCL